MVYELDLNVSNFFFLKKYQVIWQFSHSFQETSGAGENRHIYTDSTHNAEEWTEKQVNLFFKKTEIVIFQVLWDSQFAHVILVGVKPLRRDRYNGRWERTPWELYHPELDTLD